MAPILATKSGLGHALDPLKPGISGIAYSSPPIHVSPTPLPCSNHSVKLEDSQPLGTGALYTISPEPETKVLSTQPSIPFDKSMSGLPEEPGTGLAALALEVQGQTKERQRDVEENGNTSAAYARHYSNYQAWWPVDQARRKAELEAETPGAVFVPVPALPITAVKAALFLEYERKRPMTTARGKVIPNTRISHSTVLQTVSALEWYRNHHHRDADYQACPESLIPLRQNPDIMSIQLAAQQTEASRQNESQQMKANGTHSQTFMRDEVREVASGLLVGKDKKELALSLRDRAMLLLSVTMAMRGDNVRPICWSDMVLRQVSMKNIGEDASEQAFVITSNQGKTNRNGRLDFHGALRHRHPELCAIGAVAMHLFAYFHIEKNPLPDFTPDFHHAKATNLGYRGWYQLKLFPGGKSRTEGLSRAGHIQRVNGWKQRYDIQCDKATHGGRSRGAEDAMEFGATVDGIMNLGLWAQGSSFRAAYNRMLPLDAMLALAHFNGERKDNYFIARDHLEPPNDLLTTIFPWIEDEEAKYTERLDRYKANAKDNSLAYFLAVMRSFRRILLQDVAAIAWKQSGNVSLLNYPPFNTPTFLAFADTAGSIIETAERKAEETRHNLPEQLAQVFSVHLTGVHIQLEEVKQALNRDATASPSPPVDNPLKRKAESQTVDGSSSRLARPLPTEALSASMPPKSPRELQLDSTPSLTGSGNGTDVISGQGTIYSRQTFPISADPEVHAAQIRNLTELEAKFPPEKIRIHTFEWVTAIKGSTFTGWLPEFDQFWTPNANTSPTREEIWREHMEGIGLRFSIMELNTHFGARWKRNKQKIKSESSRRAKIIKLVELLMAENSWEPARVFTFLDSHYPIASSSSVPHLKSSRKFCDWLQSKTESDKRYQDIVAASKSFV